MKKFLKYALVCASAMLGGAAHAATYNFSYAFDEFASISGVLEGSVSGNILTVSDVVATFESTGGTFGIRSSPLDTSSGGFHISGDLDPDPGRVGLDSSLFDLAVVGLPVSRICSTGEGFCLLDDFASANFGGTFRGYTLDSAAFSISSIAAVPLPAAGWMLLAGLGGLGITRRRKSRLAA